MSIVFILTWLIVGNDVAGTTICYHIGCCGKIILCNVCIILELFFRILFAQRQADVA